MKSSEPGRKSKDWSISRAWLAIKKALKIRRDLPPGLEKEFTEYKDIHSIDRMAVGAWIGFGLSILLFPLDYSRILTGEYYTNHNYRYLSYFHLLGVIYLIPAWTMTFGKDWVIATKLRRGIHIWGMVILTFIFLFGQAIVVFIDRDGLVMYMAFIFICWWMFSMSHKERTLFIMVTLGTMFYVIHSKDGTSYPKVAMYYEIGFLTLIVFFFDAFDFNLKVTTFLDRRAIEKSQQKIIKLEEFKSRFFTNLTHELRTPLTIITGMAREIKEDPKRWAEEGSEIIGRNSGYLFNLINQILDLSKIEDGSLKVKKIQSDVVSYLGYVVDAFKGHAYAKKIHLHFLSEEDEIIMDFDPDKYMAILSNLLSNAIKFTPEGGNIYVQLILLKREDDARLEICVRDTGIGIPAEALPYIFERFYQVENNEQISGIGTGIGLSVVNEFVKMLNGEIKVKSVPDKGTQFNLFFPVKTKSKTLVAEIDKGRITQDVIDFYTPLSSEELEDIKNGTDDRPEVLIIEDNADVIKYLQVCLGDLFQLSFSQNGQDGINKAIERVPDLILSDVMMPGKDGLEVCKELKHHQCTSHIPIVLLSAKSDLDSRVAGLDSGADVYMLKPFDKRELRAQLARLLEERQEHQSRYADPTIPLEEVPSPGKPMEDEFVTRVRNAINDRLDDDKFSVMHLCRAVFLSRTQLHKKLKALTGLPAREFITELRLFTALDLLKTTDLSITEIAYRVGFSDPNYFTRCFTAKFGKPPSETRK